jgi:hypothetical protein
MIEYQVAEFTDSDNTVEVTYTNDQGNVHKRTLNIPRNSDGSLNEDMWAEILEGQLRGVERKVEVNAISFVSPSETVENPDDITPEPPPVPEDISDSVEFPAE